MTDQRLTAYREGASAMRRGLFHVDLPIGSRDEVGALGQELNQLATTLEQQFEQSGQLLRMTEKINSGLLLDDVLDCVYRYFRHSIPYDRIGCALIEDRHTVRAVWARTEYPECHLYKGYSLPIDATSLERIMATREPRIINDLEEYARTHPASASTSLMLQEGIRASLTCPLVAEGKPVGFLFFSNRAPNTYRDHHTNIYREIAGHLSHIVEKARLYEQLLRLNAEKNRFLGMAAHDLRNPLTAIYGLLQLLRDEPELPPKQHREFVSLMIEACEGMVPMIEDLLDLSAIEAGTLRLKITAVLLKPYLAKVVALNASLAHGKGTEVRLEYTDPLPDTVHWDPQRVTQVLGNLISNGVKYSPPGSLVRVQVASTPDRGVQVRVTDQGPGIAPEEQDRLFKPYSRASARPTGGEKSTGLGLAIARRVVIAHGGTIGLESEIGAGSTFWVVLPAEPPPLPEDNGAPVGEFAPKPA